MAFYKAQWAIRTAAWPEPIEAGKILDLTDEQAAMLNRDSPGVVKPIELAEVDDKPKPKERAVDEAPKTTARRSVPRKRARGKSDED